MTRYELFNKISDICEMRQTGEHQYNKMIQSGGLAETHCDYGRGYYDVCIYYKEINGKHVCRVWFGTIDDGEYGFWKNCSSKAKAVKMVERIKNKFKDMVVLPGHVELNEIFRDIGVYFCHE